MTDKPPVAEEAEERWARIGTAIMCLLCGGALAFFAVWDAVERVISHGRQALWSVAIQDFAILIMAVLLIRIGLHSVRKARRPT